MIENKGNKCKALTVEVSVKDTNLFTEIVQLMGKFRDDIRVPDSVKREFDIELKKIMDKY